MKIDVYDLKELIDLNKLPEITSPILFQHGDIPHPEGLISNEIFGVTTRSRRETYAYIDLHGNFFHPHILKAIRRMFRNIDKIINGEMYYILDKDGRLVPNDNGETGLDFLYDNWEKINWEPKNPSTNKGMRSERITLLKKCKKNEIFMRYQLVIPAFYRDIKTSSDTNGGETDDINNLYCKLIRLSSLINNRDMFDFQFNSTKYNIQSTIMDIYDYFKHKLEKKNGIIRKYLMGKSVDYCTRTVITAPAYHADTPEELFVDFRHSSIPLSQVCSLAYPFILQYVKSFFEREVFDQQHAIQIYDPTSDELVPKEKLKFKNPESYFSDKYIKKCIDTFIKDPESRFNKIELPIESNQKYYLAFSGKRFDDSNKSELSAIIDRPMTWCDLLYIAAEYVTRNKHVLITRYPINDDFGVFLSKIRVASTVKTMPLYVNGYLYKFYPVIELDTNPDDIGNKFIDATQFSNSYLEGINGDLTRQGHHIKINLPNCWKLLRA